MCGPMCLLVHDRMRANARQHLPCTAKLVLAHLTSVGVSPDTFLLLLQNPAPGPTVTESVSASHQPQASTQPCPRSLNTHSYNSIHTPPHPPCKADQHQHTPGAPAALAAFWSRMSPSTIELSSIVPPGFETTRMSRRSSLQTPHTVPRVTQCEVTAV
jgi:hypothetical protein